VTPTRPRSRRERPAKAALSRESIIDAALAVLESDGIEKLTMRRLAAELDTGPASLYVYVRSTTVLHALLIDRLLARLDLTWSGRGDWRRRLRTLLIDYSGLLMRHPGLARSAMSTWPEGPHYLDLIELMLRLLTAGGVPVGRAAWGVDVLLAQATAMAAEHGTRAEDGQDTSELAAVLSDATDARHPILSSLGAAGMMTGDQLVRRDWSLDVTINGIIGTAHPDELT
jgi:AcrR family transcriptional regulator